MTEDSIKKWGKVRKKGKQNYVLIKCGIFYGEAIALAIFLISEILALFVDPNFRFTIPFMPFTLCPLIAIYLGTKEWEKNEKIYNIYKKSKMLDSVDEEMMKEDK